MRVIKTVSGEQWLFDVQVYPNKKVTIKQYMQDDIIEAHIEDGFIFPKSPIIVRPVFGKLAYKNVPIYKLKAPKQLIADYNDMNNYSAK